MRDVYPNMEKPSQLFARLARARQLLRQYVTSLEVSGETVADESILVVSHNRALKYLVGSIDEHGNPVAGGKSDFDNGELYSFELELYGDGR